MSNVRNMITSQLVQGTGWKSDRMLVTPELAQSWIDNCLNPLNRSSKHIEQYASDMENDYWLPTTEGISFEGEIGNSLVLNGETRIRAIVNSNKSIIFPVYAYAEKSGLPGYDRGAARTSPQVGKMLEEDTTANGLYRIIKAMEGTGNASALSLYEIKKYGEKYSLCWNDIYPKIERIKIDKRSVRQGFKAGALIIAKRNLVSGSKNIGKFLSAISAIILREEVKPVAARNLITWLENHTNSGGSGNYLECAAFIRSYERYLEGAELSHLKITEWMNTVKPYL